MVYEIGDEGVERLVTATFSFAEDVDERAAAWAREYLFRAGLEQVGTEAETGAQKGVELTLPRPELKSQLKSQGLEEALAAISGCYLAAEAIKEVIGYGERGSIEEALEAIFERA